MQLPTPEATRSTNLPPPAPLWSGALPAARTVTGPTCTATTWVSATMPSGVTQMHDIAYGNGLFVAVSGALTGQARVLTSTDGVIWTSSSTPVPNNTGFNDIAYGNGVFVGTGGGGSDRVMYSTDGITWNPTGVTNVNWEDVQYANGIFMIASSSSGSSGLQTSTNGISFTLRTMPPVSNSSGLAYGNGRWVVVARSSANRAAYSTDNGVTWTAANTNLSSYTLYAVTFGAGKFLAVGDTGAALTSVDGANWTVVSTTLTRQWMSAAYGHGRFVIGAEAATRLMTSVDGITWTNVTPAGISGRVSSIIAGPDRFYLTENASRGIWYSTN